jgi:hypothetical protein
MSGAIHLLLLYDFTTWTGKSDLHFYLSPLCTYNLMAQTYLETFAPPLIYLELIGRFRDICTNIRPHAHLYFLIFHRQKPPQWSRELL